jgi:hypothetical protein
LLLLEITRPDGSPLDPADDLPTLGEDIRIKPVAGLGAPQNIGTSIADDELACYRGRGLPWTGGQDAYVCQAAAIGVLVSPTLQRGDQIRVEYSSYGLSMAATLGEVPPIGCDDQVCVQKLAIPSGRLSTLDDSQTLLLHLTLGHAGSGPAVDDRPPVLNGTVVVRLALLSAEGRSDLDPFPAGSSPVADRFGATYYCLPSPFGTWLPNDPQGCQFSIPLPLEPSIGPADRLLVSMAGFFDDYLVVVPVT